MISRRTISVNVDVDIDPMDLDDDVLLDELDARGLGPTRGAEGAYYALKRGDMAAVEEFILEAAGRVA